MSQFLNIFKLIFKLKINLKVIMKNYLNRPLNCMGMMSIIYLTIFSCSPAPKEKNGETGSKEPKGLVEEEIMYTSDSLTMKGFMVYDNQIGGKRPAVLVVHEWWGHNHYARKRARMLAELGYVAFAVDMYGDGKIAEHPKDATALMEEVMANIDNAKARFIAALNAVKSNQMTDGDKVAAIGYCFGGGVVLHMARMGVDLDGVVSFHGSLGTQMPAESGKVTAKVLVCNGADDPFTPKETVAGFKNEMESAGVDYEFIDYEGAVHSFTSMDADTLGAKFEMPLAYNEAADKDSWQRMQQFFKIIFADSID